MKSHYGLLRYNLIGYVLFFPSNRSTCWRREKGECFRPSVHGKAPAAVPHASVPRLLPSVCPSSPKPPRPPHPRHITAAPCPATPTPPAGRPSAKTRRTRKIRDPQRTTHLSSSTGNPTSETTQSLPHPSVSLSVLLAHMKGATSRALVAESVQTWGGFKSLSAMGW